MFEISFRPNYITRITVDHMPKPIGGSFEAIRWSLCLNGNSVLHSTCVPLEISDGPPKTARHIGETIIWVSERHHCKMMGIGLGEWFLNALTSGWWTMGTMLIYPQPRLNFRRLSLRDDMSRNFPCFFRFLWVWLIYIYIYITLLGNKWQNHGSRWPTWWVQKLGLGRFYRSCWLHGFQFSWRLLWSLVQC